MENPYELAVKRAHCEVERVHYWRENAAYVDWFKFPTKIIDITKS